MSQFSVELHRRIPGPRHAVYRAFLDPETLVQWMCPRECVVSSASVDERVGGRHVVEMLSSDGSRFAFSSVIRELVPDERIVLDFAFDGDGSDEVTHFEVSFRDVGEGTEVRLLHERITVDDPRNPESVDAGWTGVLDKLEAHFERS